MQLPTSATQMGYLPTLIIVATCKLIHQRRAVIQATSGSTCVHFPLLTVYNWVGIILHTPLFKVHILGMDLRSRCMQGKLLYVPKHLSLDSRHLLSNKPLSGDGGWDTDEHKHNHDEVTIAIAILNHHLRRYNKNHQKKIRWKFGENFIVTMKLIKYSFSY